MTSKQALASITEALLELTNILCVWVKIKPPGTPGFSPGSICQVPFWGYPTFDTHSHIHRRLAEPRHGVGLDASFNLAAGESVSSHVDDVITTCGNSEIETFPSAD